MPPGPKPGTPRRVSSSLSKVSTPPATAAASTSARSAKSQKPSKVVHFKISKDQLRRFPHEQRLKKSNHPKASPLSTSKVITPDEDAEPDAAKPESEATPEQDRERDSSSPVKPTSKSEGPISTKAGVKREAEAVTENEDKDKAKTQARKRARPDPNKPDGRTAAAKAMKQASGVTSTTHKLGPKANQGIINAGLRALDRTGKPCRKWNKKGIVLKSFTGQVWEVPSWNSLNGRAFGSESEQDSSRAQSKADSSSNIGDDKSPAVVPSNQASSPMNGVSTPV